MKTVKHALYAATLAGSLAGLFGAAQAVEHPDAALAREAKIGSAQARSIALKTFPGTVVKAELEREQGGSGLRYSYVIRQAAALHEVGVDAKTGKILENRPEAPSTKD